MSESWLPEKTDTKGYISGANAGGYCHRTIQSIGGQARTVWFSDELTPRLDWTWENFYISASIRFYCWQRCACSNFPTRENTTSQPSTTKLWNFVRNHPLTHKDDGSFVYRASASKEVQVLPPQNRLGTPAGTCGADGKQFCPAPWPTEILGPIPQTPPGSTEVLRTPGSRNMTLCGNRCSGPEECGSDSPETDCFCALPSPNDAHNLGIDPVASPFVCLALVSSTLVGSLAGRGIRGYIDERGEEYQCLCNETFVAAECCDLSRNLLHMS